MMTQISTAWAIDQMQEQEKLLLKELFLQYILHYSLILLHLVPMKMTQTRYSDIKIPSHPNSQNSMEAT